MNKKRLVSAILALTMTIGASDLSSYKFQKNNQVKAVSDNVLAFPGASGAGRYATGGRGGEVVHVTNLNDSGEGSFREAVSKSNRIVVFDVSGTIELKSNILVSSNVTIAGQTAPGGSGITLKNYKLGMSGDNIICRYISSRPGPYASTSSGNDAWGGAKGSNSIIDHCSMGWTTDEQWGLYSNNEYYTVQYSVIGPADSWGGHSKGIHGFGLMMGKGYSTFDHNLIVHNVSRNFRGKVVGTSTADFTNNVIYNWAYQTAYGTIGHLNYVNNTLKMGNGTVGGKHYVSVDSSTKPENFSIYLNGNRMLNKDDTIFESVTTDNWNGITVKDGLGITKDSVKSDTSFETIVNGVNVSTALTAESAEDSYSNVLSFAGNGISPELRTAIDRQSTEECRTGTGYHTGTAGYDEANDSEKSKIDSYQIKCGVSYDYPASVFEKTIIDTDNDGMPDEWELLRGLNPDDSSDTNGDYCGQGYTNIEYYINDLTINSFPKGTVTLSPETAEINRTSAFELIEAENYSEQSGIKAEDCSEGGQNVGYIENGDYILFKNIDFEDGAKSFNARTSGSPTGNKIEIYIDDLNTSPVGICYLNSTENWQTWTDSSCNIDNVEGVHNLYLKFTGTESGYLFNVNNFVFSKSAEKLNGKLIKDLNIFDYSNASGWVIQENFNDNSLLFGDRDTVALNVPEEIKNSEIICTACDSKFYENTQGEFNANADISVYIAIDSRVSIIPEWLNNWETSELTFNSSNDVTFNLYKKDFKNGEVISLGTNGQSAYCVNYIALAKESSPKETTTSTNISTTTTTTTTTSADIITETTTDDKIKVTLLGDANCDGKIAVADAAAVAANVSNAEKNILTEQGRINADVHMTGNDLNASDAMMIQQYSTGIISSLE